MKNLSLLLLAGVLMLVPMRVSGMMIRGEVAEKGSDEEHGDRKLDFAKATEAKTEAEQIKAVQEAVLKGSGNPGVGNNSEVLEKENYVVLEESVDFKPSEDVFNSSPSQEKSGVETDEKNEEENLFNLTTLEQRVEEAWEVIAHLNGKGSSIPEKELHDLYDIWSKRDDLYQKTLQEFQQQNKIGSIASQQIEERLGELVKLSQVTVEKLQQTLDNLVPNATRAIQIPLEEKTWQEKILEQNFSTEPDGAVFWTGYKQGNLARAKKHAEERLKKILEKTQGGLWMEMHKFFTPEWFGKRDADYSVEEANALFNYASKQFVERVSGHVMAFILDEKHPGYNGKSIYNQLEKKKLKNNPRVFLSEIILKEHLPLLTEEQKKRLKTDYQETTERLFQWFGEAKRLWDGIAIPSCFKANQEVFLTSHHSSQAIQEDLKQLPQRGELNAFTQKVQALAKSWDALPQVLRNLKNLPEAEQWQQEIQNNLLQAEGIETVSEAWKDHYDWLQEARHVLDYHLFKAKQKEQESETLPGVLRTRYMGSLKAHRDSSFLENSSLIPSAILTPQEQRITPFDTSHAQETSERASMSWEEASALLQKDALLLFNQAKEEAEKMSHAANNAFFYAINNQSIKSWKLAEKAADMAEHSCNQVLEKNLDLSRLDSADKISYWQFLDQIEDQKKFWSQKNQFAQKKLSSLEAHQHVLREPINIHSLHTTTTVWKELLKEHQALLENYSNTMTPTEKEAWDQELKTIVAKEESLQRLISEIEKESKPKPILKPELIVTPEKTEAELSFSQKQDQKGNKDTTWSKKTPEQKVQQEIFQRKAREAQQASQQASQRVRKYAWENNSDYASKDAVSAWQKVSFYWTQAAKNLEEGKDPFLLEAAAMEATKASQWYEESVKDGIEMLCQDWKLSSAAKFALKSAEAKAEAAPWKTRQQEAHSKGADTEAQAWEEAIQLALKVSGLYEESAKQDVAGNAFGKGGYQHLENAARSTLGSAKAKAEIAFWKAKQQEAHGKRANAEVEAWEEVIQLALKASEFYEESAKQFTERNSSCYSDQGYNLESAARSTLESAKTKAEIIIPWRAKQQEARNKRADTEAQAWEEAIQLALQASIRYGESAEQFIVKNGSTSRDKGNDLRKAAELVLESAKAKAEIAFWKAKQQEAYSKRANAEAQAWEEVIQLALKDSGRYKEAAKAKAAAILWKAKQQEAHGKRANAEAQAWEEAVQLALKASMSYEESAKQDAEREWNKGNNLRCAAKSTLELAKTKAEIIIPWKIKQQEASNKKADAEALAWEEAIKQALKASKLYGGSAAAGYADAIIKERDEANSILESAKAKAEAAPWKSRQQEAHSKGADAETQAWEEAIQLALQASERYEESAKYNGKYDFRQPVWWNTASSILELAKAKAATIARASF